MQGGMDENNATLKQYQAKAEFFLCACIQKNNGYNVAKTPGLFPINIIQQRRCLYLKFVLVWFVLCIHQEVCSISMSGTTCSTFRLLRSSWRYTRSTSQWKMLTFTAQMAKSSLLIFSNLHNHRYGFQSSNPKHLPSLILWLNRSGWIHSWQEPEICKLPGWLHE